MTLLHRIRRYIDGMFGRRLNLVGIREATKVHIEGTIASPNAVSSPVTVVRAAVLTHALIKQKIHRDNNGQSYVSYEPFEVHTESVPELLLETPDGTVALAGGSFEALYATSLKSNPQPLQGKPPAAMREAIEQAEKSEGEILYNERYMSHGDRVALRAVVEPTRGGAGPYRGGERQANFVVVEQAERPRLRELWSAPDFS